MNCFWMATDPEHPDDLFAENRTGKFSDYHNLRLYYVGMGGHDNTKTRFRRYKGDGSRPLKPEHDLSASEYLLKANQTMDIQIEVTREGTRYFRDGQMIYNVKDDNPYMEGWFGFRTVRNRMAIHDLEVQGL